MLKVKNESDRHCSGVFIVNFEYISHVSSLCVCLCVCVRMCACLLCFFVLLILNM